jgi:hypothetical protein
MSEAELVKNTIEHLASSIVVAFSEDPKFGVELVFATTSRIDDQHFTEILVALKTKISEEDHYKEVSKILTGLREVNKLDKACDAYTTHVLNRFIKAMNEPKKDI